MMIVLSCFPAAETGKLMRGMRHWGRLLSHPRLLCLLALFALGLTACALPASRNPAPPVTPTWGIFYPTLVPFRPTVPTAVPTPPPAGGRGDRTDRGEE